MLTRRQALQRSSLIAVSPTIPLLFRQTASAITPDRHDRVLVVIQLSGGNDGFNTVVHFDDDPYIKLRPKLKITKDRAVQLVDGVGLHPSMKDVAELFEAQQQLAIVEGVGYPNPNRSHDVSMAIWHTAQLDVEEHQGYGWLGRALDRTDANHANGADSILVGTESTPVALRGRRCRSANISSIDEFSAANLPPTPAGRDTDVHSFLADSFASARGTAEMLEDIANAGTSSTTVWPATEIGSRLKLTSQLIQADLGTRVFYVAQGGYDTHATQLRQHSQLLRSLSGSLKAFWSDLTQAGLSDRVLVMCFSEFGRQLGENASGGTDHGTAGPVLLLGSDVTGGLLGQAPDLNHLVDNAPEYTTDFRSVYASVLSEWLRVEPQTIVGGDRPDLGLLRS